jgi:hypothetical protein
VMVALTFSSSCAEPHDKDADELSPPAAASLLDDSHENLAVRLLATPQAATGSEAHEFSELPEEHLVTSGRRGKG